VMKMFWKCCAKAVRKGVLSGSKKRTTGSVWGDQGSTRSEGGGHEGYDCRAGGSEDVFLKVDKGGSKSGRPKSDVGFIVKSGY